MSDANRVILKVKYRDFTFRFPMEKEQVNYEHVLTQLQQNTAYLEAHLEESTVEEQKRPCVIPPSILLQYQDDEQEIITVTNEIEFQEASRVLASDASNQGFLRFQIYDRKKTPIHQRFIPIILAVETVSSKVARAALNSKEHLAQNETLQRGRESLQRTSSSTAKFVSSSMKDLLANLSEWKGAVQARYAQLRRTSEDDPFESAEIEKGKEEQNTSEGHVYTLVGGEDPLLQKMQKEDKSEVQGESDNDTASEASDGEAEEVESANADEMEASSQNSQFAFAREIVPDLDEAQFDRLLELHHGDLEQVLESFFSEQAEEELM